MQEIGALLVLAIALGYLLVRTLKRRGNNCCGEKECPAAKQMVERMIAGSKISENGLSGFSGERGENGLTKDSAKVVDSGHVHSG